VKRTCRVFVLDAIRELDAIRRNRFGISLDLFVCVDLVVRFFATPAIIVGEAP